MKVKVGDKFILREDRRASAEVIHIIDDPLVRRPVVVLIINKKGNISIERLTRNLKYMVTSKHKYIVPKEPVYEWQLYYKLGSSYELTQGFHEDATNLSKMFEYTKFKPSKRIKKVR